MCRLATISDSHELLGATLLAVIVLKYIITKIYQVKWNNNIRC